MDVAADGSPTGGEKSFRLTATTVSSPSRYIVRDSRRPPEASPSSTSPQQPFHPSSHAAATPLSQTLAAATLLPHQTDAAEIPLPRPTPPQPLPQAHAVAATPCPPQVN
ncbi:hypothetical protein Salat_1271500 [Sesamum alatum]|uniref:Uncharacterized protein n=1 Tax=Sesamum alatum TaxID=300844 RepID=A0AAE2CPS1_9LAMI|nr:hypothetical protein Salat_1271500 [Sesamum alatum]